MFEKFGNSRVCWNQGILPVCEICKNCGNIECISIQEEVEQAAINESVKINLELGYNQAKLPFLPNPKYRLGTNDNIARSIYFRQVRKPNENPKDTEDVLKAKKKLRDLGFVDFIRNLTDGQKISFILKYHLF